MKFLTLLALLCPVAAKANLECLRKALIQVESGGRPTAVNTTKLGVSHGLMQIQLSTARDMGFRGELKELYKPEVNKTYGTRYIQWLMKRYKNNVFSSLDAYNRGIKMVETYPYKGDWKQHRYVGLILKELDKICPDYYKELTLAN